MKNPKNINECPQYNFGLPVTVTIKGTFNEKSLEFLFGYTPSYRKTMMYCFGKCQGISTKEG